jgi:O-antigen/teichoic acid export membrane protein
MNIKGSKVYKFTTEKLGVDGAIAYSSAARIFQAFSGVISIFFIATFLSGEEQGFYYTFGSILAVQVFFELGFTGIMTQYVAHEAVHLNLNKSFHYEGESKYKSRLAYLARFCIKWYTVIAVLFLLVVLIAGFVFFYKYDETKGSVNWQVPWLLLATSTALKLFLSPFTAIFTGLGKVKDMNKIAFYQQLIIPISQWVLFACGVKLYVVGISSMLGVIIWCVFVWKSTFWKILYYLFKEKITEKISYMKDIFPYQWKIAISWISGYFIFQLFNPVLFATEGATVAGQMGMTLNILSAIQAFALNWQNTKIPAYSGLIEMKRYNELDSLFNKTTIQMNCVCLGLLTFFFIGVLFLRVTDFSIAGSVLGNRFLDYLPMFLMMITIFVNINTSAWATYLRCHKQEPILVTSVVVAILCCLSTFILGNIWGVLGITGGYCAIRLFVSLPWIHNVFITKKRVWHEKN